MEPTREALDDLAGTVALLVTGGCCLAVVVVLDTSEGRWVVFMLRFAGDEVAGAVADARVLVLMTDNPD